ncbi:MAG: ATP-dependent Clp protease adaptor ClpS [Chloroflexi bacterium]|nr:ATP-dependent Clp protease adaptor ClpS [Chloroflexota bacterium]
MARRKFKQGPFALAAEPDIQEDVDTEIDSLTEDDLEPPYKVLIHNDEVTPYDFVLIVLRRFFQLSPPDAEYVTYLAHTKGLAYVATLPLREAQKRVGQAHFAASLEGYPLTFTIEPE